MSRCAFDLRACLMGNGGGARITNGSDQPARVEVWAISISAEGERYMRRNHAFCLAPGDAAGRLVRLDDAAVSSVIRVWKSRSGGFYETAIRRNRAYALL